MNDYKTLSKTVLVSLVVAIFVSYPNLLFMNIDRHNIGSEAMGCYLYSMLMRFLLFWVLILCSLLMNRNFLKSQSLVKRILPNFLLTLVGFGVYKGMIAVFCPDFDCRPIILTFQFVVLGAMGIMLGYTDFLSRIHQKKVEELRQLQVESLQSRCTALTNQINPHFFFNSLNGISSLVRKKDEKVTICYIDHLSDIFRYILQSERKVVATLEEELEFARSFSEVMQVRYAGKFDVTFDVPDDCMHLQIPVLALLPLIENVTVHNMIDSEHRMNVLISMNDKHELIVSNPYYPKQYKSETHGTGIKNLEKRFALLMDKKIRVEKTDDKFSVVLPLAE